MLVEFCTSVTKEIWPEAELKVFGSYATGMFLPSSDVDMVVVNCSDCDPLVKLAKGKCRGNS